MQQDHFDEALKAFKHRSPYRPFTIALVNGDRLEVDHPDALVVRGGVAVYLSPGGIPVIFDFEGVSQFTGYLKGHDAASE